MASRTDQILFFGEKYLTSNLHIWPEIFFEMFK